MNRIEGGGMIAYCGLDCSQCEGYLATQAGDEEQLAKVARTWSAQFHSDVKPEHVLCDGCKAQGRKSFYCGNLCKIRACCIGRNYGTCIECGAFPCKEVGFVLEHAPEARSNLERLKKR